MSGIEGVPYVFATLADAPAWMRRCAQHVGPCGPEAPACPRCGRVPACPNGEVREVVDLRTGATVRAIWFCGID